MQRYNLPRTMPKLKMEDPFEKYNITDEYIHDCTDIIAKELKEISINDYAKFENDVDRIVKNQLPKLNEFISNYGIGVFGFLAQFRNEIRFKIE